MATVAQVGPPVTRGTRERNRCPGRRRSRAIAHVRRDPVARQIMPQQKIETQMKARKIFSMLGPSVSARTKATGEASSLVALTSPTAMARVASRMKPSTPDSTTARTIALGVVRRGSWVSSEKFAADSKPTRL